MKRIWDAVNGMNTEVNKKNTWFLLICTSACLICGFLIWAIAGRLLMAGVGGALCFAGYPAVIGFLSGILYLYNHSFGNGEAEKL